MAAIPNQLSEPPPYTALENIWSTNRRVNLKLVVYDDEHWDKKNPSNDPNHTRFVKDVNLRGDKCRSMKDTIGNIWRITQKDFRATIDDPKGVWSWSAEAGFAVSVMGVVDEMSTRFCYVEGEQSRNQWYHWHSANVINKGHPVAKDVELVLSVKMVHSWEAKVLVAQDSLVWQY